MTGSDLCDYPRKQFRTGFAQTEPENSLVPPESFDKTTGSVLIPLKRNQWFEWFRLRPSRERLVPRWFRLIGTSQITGRTLLVN